MVHSTLFFIFAALMSCSGQNNDKLVEITAKSRRLPSLELCGAAFDPFGTRIINGRPAKLGQYPWMANLGYKIGSFPNVYFLCAGSLITDQYVITAAHCVSNSLTKPYRLSSVRLGELDLNDTVADGASPIDFEINETTIHSEYSDFTKVNDIALIKLQDRVQFSDNIKPICLSLPEFSRNMLVGYLPVIAGWGRSTRENTGKKDTRLLEAEVLIKDTEGCRSNLTTKLPNVVIDDRVICASSENNDACQGDSGGPLMFYSPPPRASDTSRGNVYLLGIVSYGFRCAEPGYPGVYTRVAQQMSWIVENLDI